MSRQLRSPTRSISNRGDIPRFVGELPSHKAQFGSIKFDSISALECALYLEWRSDVVLIEFEPERYALEATEDLPAIECIPDFRITLNTGEIRLVEAKSDPKHLKRGAADRLDVIRRQFDAVGMPYEVVYRSELKQNGFIDTVFLLRAFGRLPFDDRVISRALGRLSPYDSADLETWALRARQQHVPQALLNHLLYHQRLPLRYRKLLHAEIRHWRA